MNGQNLVSLKPDQRQYCGEIGGGNKSAGAQKAVELYRKYHDLIDSLTIAVECVDDKILSFEDLGKAVVERMHDIKKLNGKVNG